MVDKSKLSAPVSAEPVAWVRRHPDGALTAAFLEHAVIEPVRKISGAWVPLYTAPVAAQPDVTQQTLDDVKAGIPARDAEIEALRKEIEALKTTMSAEPVAVPKGWRLVPVSPTKEMLLAGETDEYNTAIWWDLMLAAAPAAPIATPTPAFSVGVRGVGIIDDNPSALAVYFNAAPNDDDIRALHEIVTTAPVAAQAHQVDGWQLVPIEPTDAMTWVGQHTRYPAANSVTDIWKAMLKESPPAPVAAQTAALECRECGGIEFENGPVRCVKDCEVCNGTGRQPVSGAGGVPVNDTPAAWMVYSSDTHQLKRIVTTDPGDAGSFGCLALPLYTRPAPVAALAQQGGTGQLNHFRGVRKMVEPSGNSGELKNVERAAITALIDCAAKAFFVADDAEDDGIEDIKIPKSGMEELNSALDKLDDLPDDQPGYSMGPSSKAEWALRRLLRDKAQPLAQQEDDIGNPISNENQGLTQQDADRVDAERYRWLRDHHIGDDAESINLLPAPNRGLDAAIDAARKEQAR